MPRGSKKSTMPPQARKCLRILSLSTGSHDSMATVTVGLVMDIRPHLIATWVLGLKPTLGGLGHRINGRATSKASQTYAVKRGKDMLRCFRQCASYAARTRQYHVREHSERQPALALCSTSLVIRSTSKSTYTVEFLQSLRGSSKDGSVKGPTPLSRKSS